jgi:hypothetical protein
VTRRCGAVEGVGAVGGVLAARVAGGTASMGFSWVTPFLLDKDFDVFRGFGLAGTDD